MACIQPSAKIFSVDSVSTQPGPDRGTLQGVSVCTLSEVTARGAPECSATMRRRADRAIYVGRPHKYGVDAILDPHIALSDPVNISQHVQA